MASQHLSSKEAERIINAASFCIAQYGVSFDTHLTLAWEAAGIHDHDLTADRFVELKNRIQKRMVRKFDQPAHFVYVHENARDRGFHTHLLLHADLGSGPIKSVALWRSD